MSLEQFSDRCFGCFESQITKEQSWSGRLFLHTQNLLCRFGMGLMSNRRVTECRSASYCSRSSFKIITYFFNKSVRRQSRHEYICGPSLISNLRPVRGLSDREMANIFASGVAKSTYANLTNTIGRLFQTVIIDERTRDFQVLNQDQPLSLLAY